MLRAACRRPLRTLRCRTHRKPRASPPHLSLCPVHRRGWGSLYAALSKGRLDEAGLKDLLAALSPRDTAEPPVYAVDVSPWPRCDAEASPGRGYLYHPSRHSAGQPIVAGWAYQLVAGLSFERDSWMTPVDAERVEPQRSTEEVAAEHVRQLVGRLPEREEEPLFVFDAGYDPVKKLQLGLNESAAQIAVRLNPGRTFYFDPRPSPNKRPVGRPLRHGEKFDLKDSETWPRPTHEYHCLAENYGFVRVRAWSGLHPKTRKAKERYGSGSARVVTGHSRAGRGRTAAAGPQAQGTESVVAVVARKGHPGPRSALASLHQKIQPRARGTLLQAGPTLDLPSGATSRAGGPLDVARARRLRAASPREGPRLGSQAAVGKAAAGRQTDPDTGPSEFRDTHAPGRHPGQGAETPR